MYFQALQLRLIAILKGRVRSGELTERRLARLTGVSQPHIHNVLKGARIFSPETADQILENLRISIFDLFQPDELAMLGRLDGAASHRYDEVPVLEGRIGPGYPLPVRESPVERHLFLRSEVAGLESPVAARLAADPAMDGVFDHDDLVLLDRSPTKRSRVDTRGLYLVATGDGGVVRGVRELAGAIYAADAGFSGRLECISRSTDDILKVVLAKVVWIGRDMERNTSGRKAAQETGGPD